MYRSQKFLTELSTLLAKYDAELTCEDNLARDAYGTNIRITAEFKDCKIEDIDLGDVVCPKSIDRILSDARINSNKMPKM